MVAIYARQSIDKKDSISIETQIECCKKLISNSEEYKVYSDKGWSGKNIDRPQFAQLLMDLKNGTITKIVVYKLDRISRSLYDFAGLVEEFEKHNVEFVSTVETFDTSTPMGRAMLGIIMVFAQLERENILMRVKDNYYARGKKGMFLGGPPIYGFDKVPTNIDGVKTSVLVPNEKMEIVRYMYQTYSDGNTSLGDIVRELNSKGITSPNNTPWDSCKISRLLRSPTYVMADVDVYHYFKNKGCKITSSIDEFTGERGCFVYGKRPGNERKYANVKDHYLTLGLHNGVIIPELWLAVQRKLDGNEQLKRGKTGSHSWLTGLIKCGKCGYALKVYQKDYFYCSGKSNHSLCDGFEQHPVITEVEEAVKSQLVSRFEEMKEVIIEENRAPADPKVNMLKISLEEINQKIQNFMNHLGQTSKIVSAMIEAEIEKLVKEQMSIEAEIEEHNRKSSAKIAYSEIIPLLNEFDDMPVESKRVIASQFISRILLWEDKIEIQWKF